MNKEKIYEIFETGLYFKGLSPITWVDTGGKLSRPFFLSEYGYTAYTKLKGIKKVSDDQEIPQSHTADQPTAPLGRGTAH